MLTAVKEIGKLIPKLEVKIDGKIIFILFDSNFSFKGIELEDFILGKIDRYLFKPGESKGTDHHLLHRLHHLKRPLIKLPHGLKMLKTLLKKLKTLKKKKLMQLR